MKNILVTGGAGFIGSHLCDYLLKKDDCKVFCLDNLFTGNKNNIKHLKDKFEFMRSDIINPMFFDIKFDEIYNLACPASPIHYQYNPIRTVKANTIGVINVLGLAKNHGAKILQASTSEVYGDPLEHPQTESYLGNVSTIGPRACYDEGKRVAETLFFDYHRTHKLDIKVVRIFNTYGPRMAVNDGRVVSNFIIQALKNEDITIYGEGNQTRSFCYVDDLVDGIYKMMNSKDFQGPVNLGNPNEMTILGMASKIKSYTHSNSIIKFKSLPKDDPKQRKPDITLAKEKLKWNPEIPVEVGFRNTIDYFSKIL
ncbi:UDP-glucuronic acid decarboxylase family protein [Nanoarchaeota archaeon]